jgi:hypothetical protein
MYAVVRERAADSGMRTDHAEEFRRFRARQPGYRGTIEATTDDGRTMILVLWDTPEQAQAAGVALEPEARRLNGPQWSGPPRVVGQGQVAYDDLSHVAAAR